MRGRDIRTARENLDFSREDLSRLLGCDKSSIGRWESSVEPKIDPPFRRLLEVLIDLSQGEELVVLGVGRMLQRELLHRGELRAVHRLLELHFERKGSENAN